MKIGVTGATGRMGGTVLEAAQSREVDIAFAVNREPEVERVRGVEVRPATEFSTLIAEAEPDVIVDFTGPVSTVEYAETAAAAGIPIVTGTTGFDDDQLASLERSGESIPVLVGANFSRGVQALVDAVQAAIASVPAYDVELTETHHNGKRDAPSGTAKMILDNVDEARGRTSERVYGRVGDDPREGDEIGVHARRAGDVTGEHEVLVAGNQEVLSLTHRAGSRSVFAEGALDAAGWILDRPAGYYRFADVAKELA